MCQKDSLCELDITVKKHTASILMIFFYIVEGLIYNV